MPFSSNPKVQIVDASGDACDDDAGRLNVNATIGVGSSTFTSYLQDSSETTATTITDCIAALTAITTCKEIIIQADFENPSYIMVGDGGVSSNDTEGIRLYAGDMLVLPISSTDNVSVRAANTSQRFNICIIT